MFCWGVKKTYSTSCHLCHGKGKYSKKQKLDVNIEPGVRNHHSIAVEINGLNATVTFRIRKHRTFRRVGNDLFLTNKITLRESLFGNRSFEVKTLDKRTLALNYPKFQSIKPVQSYCIRNEGMPIHREPNRRGQLYIKFFVEFKVQPEDMSNIQTNFSFIAFLYSFRSVVRGLRAFEWIDDHSSQSRRIEEKFFQFKARGQLQWVRRDSSVRASEVRAHFSRR